MILAFLVLCPCAPVPAAPSGAGDDHACCGGDPGLTVAAPSCCAAHDMREAQPAVASAGAAIVAPAWTYFDVVPVPASLADGHAIDGAFRASAAPLILRV